MDHIAVSMEGIGMVSSATPIKDYSQFREQAAILEACAGSGSTKFLDIGAYDPFQFSNTRALFELGWSGVMIEPEPRALVRLLSEYGNHPRVRIVAAAVANDEGMVDLFTSEDAVATISQDHRDHWSAECKYDGQITVPAITLPQISNWYGGFDMVSIDVEGHSASLCLQMLELGWEPRCFVVEHDQRMTEICVQASNRGYKMLMCNGTNGVFGK